MWDSFEAFLKSEDKKSVTKDTWQQLYHFMTTYPKDLSTYDTSCKKKIFEGIFFSIVLPYLASWPLVFDEFVEWMQEKSKK